MTVETSNIHDNTFTEFFSESPNSENFEYEDNWDNGESDFETEFGDVGFPEFYSDSGLNIYPENVSGNPDWETLAEHNIGPRELARLTMDGFESLTDSEIDDALESILSNMSDAEIESFWRRLAGIGARIVKPVAQWGGTALGTVIGGPVGGALGNAAGRAIGNFAQRGLRQAASGGGRRRGRRRRPRRRTRGRPSRSMIGRRVRRNIHQAATRVRRGQPIINQRRMSNTVRQIQGFLGSPAIQRSLANSYGDTVVDTENDFGETYPSDYALIGAAETIIDLAADLEDLLPVDVETDSEHFDHWAALS